MFCFSEVPNRIVLHGSLQANNTGMSEYKQRRVNSPETSFPIPPGFGNACLPVVLSMGLTLSCSSSFADIEDVAYMRQEPITPIPQIIDADMERAAIGELLFYDTRLSNDNSIACASCHKLESGGDDNVSLGMSHTAAQHTVNTPTVFNAIYNFRQHWDGSIERPAKVSSSRSATRRR